MLLARSQPPIPSPSPTSLTPEVKVAQWPVLSPAPYQQLMAIRAARHHEIYDFCMFDNQGSSLK